MITYNIAWSKYFSLFVCLLLIMSSNAFSKGTTTIVLTPAYREIIFPQGKISKPVLSPDNNKIAFINFKQSTSADQEDSFKRPRPAEGPLWVVSLEDDVKFIQLSERTILVDEPHVTWSSNSNSIAFGSKGDICVTELNNEKCRLLPKPDANRSKTYLGYYENYFHSPAWAPNQEAIAIGNVFDVWLYSIKNKTYRMIYSPPKELQPGAEVFYLPSIVWSHDSQKLAILRHKIVSTPYTTIKKAYIEGLAILEFESRKTTQVVGIKDYIEYYPVFSPNDKLIAFLSRKDWEAKPSIFIYDITRNKSRWVADCKDECHMLSWSQDGSKLYFASNKAIWMIELTATLSRIEKKVLVKSMADLSNVFWFPRGDTWYFLKPLEAGKYLFGSLELNKTR